MKRHPTRSALLTGVLLVAVGMLWLWLAPPQLGGSTSYVITHGVSMEPRFHTGDLALVRPASNYQVGDVVAYRSSAVNEVVLHRIVAIRNGRYTFKGDNNSFLDPVQPSRSQLVGKLWLHMARGGSILNVLHAPVTAAMLFGLVGVLLVAGTGAKRGRARRRRRADARPRSTATPLSAMSERTPGAVDRRALVIAAGAAGLFALAMLAVALIAFACPTRKPSATALPYTQSVHFGYHATTRPDDVYPTGVVTTGDPIFVHLVHRLGLTIDYALTAPTPPVLHGTEQIQLTLSGPTGWSRSFPLTQPRPFGGTHFTAHTTLDLPSLLSLITRVENQTGIMTPNYVATITAKVRVHGLLDDHLINTQFAPAVSFQLGTLQLQPGGGGSTGGSSAAGFDRTDSSRLRTAASAADTLGVLGISASVSVLRFAAPLGLLIGLCSVLTLLAVAARTPDFGESARIRAKYGHMIVPISAGEDLGWPAIDVGSIKALVRLAQAAGQLILHSPGEDVDTYLVNDEGSVYRYQVHLPKIVWGEWTTPPETEPVSDAVSPSGLTAAASRLQSLVHTLRGTGRSGT